MDKIQRPVPQHSLSYHSQSVINELRAGDSRVREAAWLLTTIWMLHQQSVGFQPVRQAPPPPHRQLFGGVNRPPHQGTYGSSSPLSQKVDKEDNTCDKFEALAYLEKRYGSNHITVDGDLKISDWQTAKKSYHGVCFGINPEDYGAKQD